MIYSPIFLGILFIYECVHLFFTIIFSLPYGSTFNLLTVFSNPFLLFPIILLSLMIFYQIQKEEKIPILNVLSFLYALAKIMNFLGITLFLLLQHNPIFSKFSLSQNIKAENLLFLMIFFLFDGILFIVFFLKSKAQDNNSHSEN